MLENLCMGCMKDRGTDRICPHCGWIEGTQPEAPVHLPPRTFLNKRYCIGRVLGQGGFGITYLAWDTVLKTPLAIKEYMPQQIATRNTGDINIFAYQSQGQKESYQYGLQKFLDEARTLAQMDDNPGVVAIRDFFEANGTAYLVMPYLDGMNLKDHLIRKGGRISFEEAMKIICPVLVSLQFVHDKGLLHRDVSPDNIFITRNGQVKLLDFGAARYAVGDQSRSLSVILKPGYAPEEQYRSKGQQGPWTDEYAAAATLYRAITGKNPPEALDRLHNDSLVPPSQLKVKIPPPAEAALLKALSVHQQNRYQTIKEFAQALTAGGDANPPVSTDKKSGAVTSPSGASGVDSRANYPPAPNYPPASGYPSAGGYPPAGQYQAPHPVDRRLSGQPSGRGTGGTYPPPGFHQGPGPARKPKKSKGGCLLITVLVLAGLLLLAWATGIIKINTGPAVVKLGYPDGTSYLGEYDKELKYTGDYVNGKYEGRGTYTWHEGSDYTVQYVGNFKNGRMEGSGTYYGRYGEIYEGTFSNGLFNGSGKLTLEDGYVYRGSFVDGLADGQGEAEFADGTVYQGDFYQGLMEGEGILTWPDGTYYTGEFSEDLPNGMGALYDENDKLIYQGPFEDGEPAAQ